ncbi:MULTISPECIES: DUF6064 family protein [unclassified Thioalkalivibrio]|uniref:DUF6064 family protein n=1 Tax=unclassified Thioalkalivibrio TaxID=2621013 RepID=UPI0003775E28|nr:MULTISPECIES: DUF6064 family protein [unclassified Thioalkalivibrio]
MLPFAAETLLSIFGQYNRAIWPLHGVAALMVLVTLALALVGGRGAGRVVGLLLAVMWVWIGVVFIGGVLAEFHFWAGRLAGVFVAQGLMLLFALTLLGRHGFGWPGGVAGLVAIVVMAYAMVGHALLEVLLLGVSWAQAQYVGVAPGPTMLFTLGILLLAQPRPSLILAIIPFLWALVTAYIAWELGIWLEYLPAALGLIAFVLLLVRRLYPGERGLFRSDTFGARSRSR